MLTYEASLQNLADYLMRLKSLGKDIFLVMPIPTGKEIDPHFVIHRDLRKFPNVFYVESNGLAVEQLDQSLHYTQIGQDLRRIAKQVGVTVIDPSSLLCRDAFCPALGADGIPMYSDGGHLNPDFVARQFDILDVTVDTRR